MSSIFVRFEHKIRHVLRGGLGGGWCVRCSKSSKQLKSPAPNNLVNKPWICHLNKSKGGPLSIRVTDTRAIHTANTATRVRKRKSRAMNDSTRHLESARYPVAINLDFPWMGVIVDFSLMVEAKPHHCLTALQQLFRQEHHTDVIGDFCGIQILTLLFRCLLF